MRIYNQDIQMEFDIKKCTMLIMKSGKRQITEGIEIPKSRKNQNTQRKGNLQVLGSRHNQKEVKKFYRMK